MYISQDPIRLAGNNPNIYAYVKDSNVRIDPLGLFDPKTLPDGNVFRGINPGQSLFSPSSRDISHFVKKGKMPGISTFNDIDTVKAVNNRFNIGMENALVIDISKLDDNLTAVLDSKDGHVSIMPSNDYLKKNNMSMLKALEDWSKGGDNHALSKGVKNAVTGTKCL